MFLSVCLNPVLQKTLVLDSFHENSVNRSREYYFDISGKGINVSRVLVQLGEAVMHLTHAGGFFREYFLHRAKAEGIPVKCGRAPGEIRFGMTLCNRENASGTEVIEEGEPVNPATETEVMKLYSRLLLKSHTVIISGRKAEGYSANVYPAMVRIARQNNKTVICDFRGDDLMQCLVYGPDIVKLNLSEFQETFLSTPDLQPVNRIDAIVQGKMEEMYRRYKSACVVTDGPHKIRYFGSAGYGELLPEKITPKNPIGSGDALAAGLASSFMKSKDLRQAVAKGEECARKNAMSYRPGTIR